MARRSKDSYTIQAVVHSLELLEQFFGYEEELRVTELSRRLSLHKNNVFRILATLEVRGYVTQNPETEGYRLGVKAFELGQAYLRHNAVISLVEPLLVKLRDETGETAYFSVLQGEEVVYILAQESYRPVRVASQLGLRIPAHRSAAGKVELAYLKELPYHRHPLRRQTDPSPQDLRRLERELERIREHGYAVDGVGNEGGMDPEVVHIAVPIFDAGGKTVGALSIAGPFYRLGKERELNQAIEGLKRSAQETTQILGGKVLTLEGEVTRMTRG
jgi:DNA-binding IclR family transcriptional regulator